MNTYRHTHICRMIRVGLSAAFILAPLTPSLALAAEIGTGSTINTKRTQAETKAEKVAKNQKKVLQGVRATGGVSVNGYPPLLIGPGDLLVIAVYGEAELPMEYQVDSNGVITFPYVGNVRMGGLSPAEASEKIARLLDKPRKVTVLIKESNTYWVSVLGHVGKPGKYQIRGKPNLLSALAEAGGPTSGAKLSKTTLIHKGVRTRIDLGKYLKGDGPMEAEPLLYPGDVLMVPKSGMPSMGSIAIVASVLASAAILVVNLQDIRR